MKECIIISEVITILSALFAELVIVKFDIGFALISSFVFLGSWFLSMFLMSVEKDKLKGFIYE